MTFIQIFLFSGAVMLVLVTVLWLISLVLHNSSIVDVFWGTGFVIAAWTYFTFTSGGALPRRLLLGALVTLWGLRLSLHILRRNWGKPEDFRYQEWRRQHGPHWWWWSFFQVFLLQGALLWVISMPLLAAQAPASPENLTWIDGLGVLVWATGFYFEAAGDAQLARFKANPANRGQVMRNGVWRYTRHPNYFGDAAQCCGFYLVALAAGGWWSVYAPVLMTYLLLRVSGVTLLEKTMSTRPGYSEYIDTTHGFFPWFPRRPKP